MPQILVYLLLLLALVVPVPATIALRLLRNRLSDTQVVSIAAAIFGVAIVSVIVLARSDVTRLQVGSLTLLLPITGSGNTIAGRIEPLPFNSEPDDLAPFAGGEGATVVTPTTPLSPGIVLEPTVGASAVLTATLTPTGTATTTATVTAEPTATPEPTPTVTPTLVVTPTVEAEPEPVEEAEPEPVEEAEPPPPRTYVVESGNTFRGIAEQFGVTVEALLGANDMTPEDSDAIYPGQELIIP
jgi:LysM repeat protein